MNKHSDHLTIGELLVTRAYPSGPSGVSVSIAPKILIGLVTS